MALPRANFTLHNAIGVAIVCFILLKEYTEGALDAKSSSSPPSTTSTSSNVSTIPTDSISNETMDSENYTGLPIPKSEEFTKPCLQSLTRYVYTAIVAHNMNKDSAKAFHRKNEKFEELAQNLTDIIMNFADQIGKMMYMYNVCTEPPIDLIESSEIVPADDSSDITVLLLLIVILVLSAYIGYLTYKIKTKYYRNSSILIDEH